ncbi:MAG: hypothetical protein QOF77_465 [Solirubrobacteraceae bacterium]|nr:hypothetical protein [Solirubrobacteraceae bacterium]
MTAPSTKLSGRPRAEAVLAAGGYLAALVLFAVSVARADRLPFSGPLVLAAFLSVHLGLGLLLGGWRGLAAPLLLVGALLAAAIWGENALVVVAVVVAVPIGVAAMAVGVAGRRALERRTSPSGVLAAGALLIAAAALPLPLALIEQARTIRVERTGPVAIDERHGTLAGLGLRARAARVRATFGPAPPWRDGEPTGPLDGRPGFVAGPTGEATGPSRRETHLRYLHAAFSIDGDRVWSVETTDRRAATSRGVGVGDSLSLVRRAYPGLRCGEDLVGEDEYTSFPYCTGPIGPGVYAYFSAAYTEPGTPVTAITVARHPLR